MTIGSPGPASQTVAAESLDTKLFGKNAISFGLVFFGFPSFVFFGYSNLKNLKQDTDSKAFLKFSLVGFVGIIVAFFLLNFFGILSNGATRSLSLVTYIAFGLHLEKKYLRKSTELAEDNKQRKHNILASLTIMVLSLVLTVLFAIALSLIASKATGENVSVREVVESATYDAERYNELVDKLQTNEQVALTAYDNQLISDEEYVARVNKGLELFKENAQLITQLAAIPNLPESKQKFAAILSEYNELRIQEFTLYKQAATTYITTGKNDDESIEKSYEVLAQIEEKLKEIAALEQ